MTCSFPWHRRSGIESQPNSESAPHIDIKTPRECILKSFGRDPGPCPRCGRRLHQTTQTYLVATRRGQQIGDSFILGTDFGWFCANCPTVVMNPADVSEFLRGGSFRWDIGEEFAVLGVIDLEAIPKNKQNVPLGEDDNPIPLVEFTNILTRSQAKRRKRRSKKHR